VESEYITASGAVKEAMWVGSMLWELGVEITCVTMYCDNQGCVQNLKNHMVSKHTKHISVSYHHARERVAWGQISPVYVPTSENVADMFTKPLASTSFEKHRASLGMI
jgi:hypothetical protein